MNGPGRDLGQIRDLGTGEAVAQVQVGQERVRDGRSGAAGKTAPTTAAGWSEQYHHEDVEEVGVTSPDCSGRTVSASHSTARITGWYRYRWKTGVTSVS